MASQGVRHILKEVNQISLSHIIKTKMYSEINLL
jgi:hypothetical protein